MFNVDVPTKFTEKLYYSKFPFIIGVQYPSTIYKFSSELRNEFIEELLNSDYAGEVLAVPYLNSVRLYMEAEIDFMPTHDRYSTLIDYVSYPKNSDVLSVLQAQHDYDIVVRSELFKGKFAFKAVIKNSALEEVGRFENTNIAIDRKTKSASVYMTDENDLVLVSILIGDEINSITKCIAM